MKNTCDQCRYFHPNSALEAEGQKDGGKCCFNPPGVMPVPVASGPRVFALHPPTMAKQTACKEFKPEEVN